MKPALRDGSGTVESAGELAGNGPYGIGIVGKINRQNECVFETGSGADCPESGF